MYRVAGQSINAVEFRIASRTKVCAVASDGSAPPATYVISVALGDVRLHLWADHKDNACREIFLSQGACNKIIVAAQNISLSTDTPEGAFVILTLIK